MAYESLADEAEKALPFRRARRLSCGSVSSYFLNLALFAAGIIIGLIPTIADDFRGGGAGRAHARSPIPTKLLSPAVPTIFAPDERYIGSSPSTHRAWARLIRNHETVFVASPASYALGRGFAPWWSPQPGRQTPETFRPTSAAGGGDERFYRISNVHQLHCVNMVRIRYFELLQGNPAPGFDPADWASHIDHCFEYLRLSVMCGDSLTMEEGSPDGAPLEWRQDPWGNPLGWGARRECIDWEGLVAWQGEMAATYNETLA